MVTALCPSPLIIKGGNEPTVVKMFRDKLRQAGGRDGWSKGGEQLSNCVAQMGDLVYNFLSHSQHHEELRMLLSDTIANLDPSWKTKENFLSPLLQSVYDEREHRRRVIMMSGLFNQIGSHLPEMVTAALCRRSSKLSRIFSYFFRENPTKAVQWFGHFSLNGTMKYGAASIVSFFYRHRQEYWNLLVWEAKGYTKTIPPNLVVKKQQLWMRLKIRETILNICESCPDFWTSNDFINSITDGGVISLDPAWFGAVLGDMILRKQGDVAATSTLKELMRQFIVEGPWSMVARSVYTYLLPHEVIDLCDMLHEDPRCREVSDNLTSPGGHFTSKSLTTLDVSWESLCPVGRSIETANFNAITPLLVTNAIITHPHRVIELLVGDHKDPQHIASAFMMTQGKRRPPPPSPLAEEKPSEDSADNPPLPQEGQPPPPEEPTTLEAFRSLLAESGISGRAPHSAAPWMFFAAAGLEEYCPYLKLERFEANYHSGSVGTPHYSHPLNKPGRLWSLPFPIREAFVASLWCLSTRVSLSELDNSLQLEAWLAGHHFKPRRCYLDDEKVGTEDDEGTKIPENKGFMGWIISRAQSGHIQDRSRSSWLQADTDFVLSSQDAVRQLSLMAGRRAAWLLQPDATTFSCDETTEVRKKRKRKAEKKEKKDKKRSRSSG